MSLTRLTIQPLIDLALREDIGTGDVTTDLTVSPAATSAAELIAKQEGVIAGLPVARWVFETLDREVQFEEVVAEGDGIEFEDDNVTLKLLARLTGRTRALLTGERVALNFLQRMSGIATMTAHFVESVSTISANADQAASRPGKGIRTQVLDTRKTTPGLRVLEKYAVRVGGGTNHRFGLYDAVLIKDNHIAACGGIGIAVARARASVSPTMRIEVETQNLRQVREALEAGADIIMLDNMTVESIREAVLMIAGKAKVEVSGGVNEDNIGDLATTGVDYISVGALTHSAPSLDISLRLL
ncbi:MAG: carboxylating nicotinate-nucleotide diphosphorylase [Armatimonadetes bacterium]|nr:carboxylating nicotinate-nucleotide diphosphorylase [Armatimonadota bacterium]